MGKVLTPPVRLGGERGKGLTPPSGWGPGAKC